MANTYKRILLHLVFAVKNREAVLDKSWRPKLFEYIHGIVNQRGHFCYAVNGYYDHLHIVFDYKAHELIQDLVREIKKSSSAFIKENSFVKGKFEWQSGYGIFSHGYNNKDTVIKYILNQEQHHSKDSGRKEYKGFLGKNEIEFKDEYVFTFFE